MIVVSPGRTSPAFTAVPKPVGTPQPTSATTSSGRSSATFTTDASDSTAYCENVPSRHIWPKSVPPSWNRNVPSGRQLSTRNMPRSQRLVWPLAQNRQCPQTGRNEATTWSPTDSLVTPGPTCSTMPAPSCPPTIGYLTGMSPVRRWSSEWHRPDATNRTRTSPVFGSSRSSSAISKSLPTSLSTAARVFMHTHPHPGTHSLGAIIRSPAPVGHCGVVLIARLVTCSPGLPSAGRLCPGRRGARLWATTSSRRRSPGRTRRRRFGAEVRLGVPSTEHPRIVPVDDYVRDELYPGYKQAFGSQPFVAGPVRPFGKADNSRYWLRDSLHFSEDR